LRHLASAEFFDVDESTLLAPTEQGRGGLPLFPLLLFGLCRGFALDALEGPLLLEVSIRRDPSIQCSLEILFHRRRNRDAGVLVPHGQGLTGLQFSRFLLGLLP
jgi:hypothetical protein